MQRFEIGIVPHEKQIHSINACRKENRVKADYRADHSILDHNGLADKPFYTRSGRAPWHRSLNHSRCFELHKPKNALNTTDKAACFTSRCSAQALRLPWPLALLRLPWPLVIAFSSNVREGNIRLVQGL
jgi:hypothetical protein